MKIREVFLFLLFALCPFIASAQIVVDCTGADKNAFKTITAALASAGPGSSIVVTGPCNENVFVQGATNLSLGAWSGQTAVINGNLSIDHSPFVYLYGLSVTNPNGDGYDISYSDVVMDSCAGSGNAGNGLNAFPASHVVAFNTASFDGNGGFGIDESGTAWVGVGAFPLDVSNNAQGGIRVGAASVFGTVGSSAINNNGSPGAFDGGVGVLIFDGGVGDFSSYGGTNVIQGNFGGGILVEEHSRVSVFGFAGGPSSTIQGNGPFGIQVANGAQATLIEPTLISDHSGPGIDVFGKGQVYISGNVQITRNGAGGDPRSAGVRLDGNSEALFRGGTVSQNLGPGILALVNSSVDFTGVGFSGNSGGVISCDSSAYMVTDLVPPGANNPFIRCRTPHSLGNGRFHFFGPPKPFDLSMYKSMQARYRKIATRH